jgi:TRAP-type transport system small permease protein
MRGLDPIQDMGRPRWERWLVAAERWICVGLLGLVLGLMAAQVVARYVLRSPIAWSEELARFGLAWLAFVGAGWVMAEGRHLVVDVLSGRWTGRGRKILDCVSHGLVVLTCVVLLPPATEFAWRMGGVKSSALGIPMSWWYFAPVTGLVLVGLHGLVWIWLTWRRDAGNEGTLDVRGGGGRERDHHHGGTADTVGREGGLG